MSRRYAVYRAAIDSNGLSLGRAPRFTRDEAIALVKAYIERGTTNPEEYFAGACAALEALAAAGAFSDWPCRHETGEMECVGPCACGTMADRLDAAGIR